jgi:hypothetical protein
MLSLDETLGPDEMLGLDEGIGYIPPTPVDGSGQ